MTTTQILVFVTEDIGFEVPGPIEPGKRFVFTNNLRLDRYDDSTPGSGLPQDPNDRMAGTHSGIVTIVRVAAAGSTPFSRAQPSLPIRGHVQVQHPGRHSFAEGPGHRTRVCFWLTPSTTSTPWSYQSGLRSLVAQGPTRQLMERSPSASQSSNTGCLTSSCESPPFVCKSFCAEAHIVGQLRPVLTSPCSVGRVDLYRGFRR